MAYTPKKNEYLEYYYFALTSTVLDSNPTHNYIWDSLLFLDIKLETNWIFATRMSILILHGDCIPKIFK